MYTFSSDANEKLMSPTHTCVALRVEYLLEAIYSSVLFACSLNHTHT